MCSYIIYNDVEAAEIDTPSDSREMNDDSDDENGEDEEYSGEQYREVTYKIGFVANDYDFQKKSDIESHIMALKMYGDWTEVNEGLTNFINDNPQLGLGGASSTPEPEPEPEPETPAPEQVSESKKRIKLRVLRG